MKSIFVLIIACCISVASNAQCDKQFKLTSSKTEYLDSSGNVQDTRTENSTLEFTKDEIVIRPGNNEENEMRGKLTAVDCKWTTPYKQGKTKFTTSLMNNRGDVNEATITLEGKDGKLTITAVAKERPDRIVRVPIDNYEEKN